MTSLEVCIVAYHNAATIGDCIESLRLLGSATSVAMVDNHPEQSTLETATESARRAGLTFRSLARPDNPGFGVACNVLAQTSQADALLFLNPDAAVRSWPGHQLLQRGVTAPRIVGQDGERQRVYGRRRSVLDEIARRMQIRPRDPNGVGYVSGAALLIPRDEFLAAGGFDDRYFMYYEDIDLCRTVVERGGSVRIEPTFVVQHIGGYSASRSPGTTALRSYDSARKFYEKWTGSTLGIDLVVLLDSALRVALRRFGWQVPGSEGAKSTLPRAWSNVRGRLQLGDRRQSSA